MKTLLVAGLLSVLSLLAQAQTYYLTLADEQLLVPKRQVAVEQVLDGRADQSAIGFVYRGLGNHPATVLFRQGMEAELTQFVQAQLPARPTDHAVVLCLRQLRVSEVLGGGLTEKATASLAVDVYAHLPDGYHFVQSAGGYTDSRALETTRLHSAHLAQVLSQCLVQLEQADWVAAAAQPALALAQLPADRPAAKAGRPSFAILRQAPRRGLYFRFEQFLANQPDTTAAFTVDTLKNFAKSELAAYKWRGVARVRPRATNTFTRQAMLSNKVWGFCDGQQLFVQHEKQYFPLARQGNFFTFIGEAPADVAYAQAHAQAQARAAFTIVAPINAQNHTGEPMAYALNMRTGELAPYSALPAPTRPDTAYVYVYRPLQTITPERVSVYVNGREAGSLRPGEYLELPWPYYTKPLQLCLAGLPVAAPCQLLVPNTTRQSYLKVDMAAQPGPWQWVPAAQGEADLDELDKLRK